MVADSQEVELGRVHRVAVGVRERAVVVAVHRELGVSVRVAAVDPVCPAAGLHRVAPDAREVGSLGGVDGKRPQLRHGARPKARRGAGRGGKRKARRADLGAAEEKLLEVAVVGRPREPELAVTVRGGARGQVLTPLRERDRHGRAPALAFGRGSEDLPRGAMRGRVAVGVADPERAMPEQEPDAARAVGDELGLVVVAAQFLRKRAFDLAGLEPRVPGPDRKLNRPPLVEARRLLLDQEPGVLAPLHAAFAPGGPEAVGAVAGERHVRLELRRRGHGSDVRPPPAFPGPDHDVVVALVVRVPRHVDAAPTVGRDRRLPVVDP